MDLLPIDRLGAREVSPGTIEFGLLLPGITEAGGFAVEVDLCHADDRSNLGIAPLRLALTQDPNGLAGYDYWSGIVTPSPITGANWGNPGQYVYWLRVNGPDGRTVDGVSDPFAREFGEGQLSAITLGYQDHAWSAEEVDWKTPDIRDLVVYELMIAEFGDDIDGTIARLDDLRSLGVNCLELMPVTNVERDEGWGYDPIGYLGVDERFGQQRDFKRLVDEAHRGGMAVILDAVYGHTSTEFAYQTIYYQLGLPSPTDGEGGPFGPKTDFNKRLMADLALTVNLYWLDRFHIDGFRYDEVAAYWHGATGSGLAELAYRTHEEVTRRVGTQSDWSRFDAPYSLRLIQCAEYLASPEVLEQSYANATWQDRTLNAARACARGEAGAIDRLGWALVGVGFPASHATPDGPMPQAPFQYTESHDHERLLCAFGEIGRDRHGDRDRWPKLQPYLIGLMTAMGVPMLWEGQEIGENWSVPAEGSPGRTALRPVRWSYGEDACGRTLRELVGTLGRVRAKVECLRRGESWYHDNPRWSSQGLLLFSRYDDRGYVLVALNFTDFDRETEFWFPTEGEYRDALSGERLRIDRVQDPVRFRIPSNYGRVWILQPGSSVVP